MRRLVKRLLFPHPLVAGLMLPAGLALMGYCALACENTHPLSIASYVLSFCGLVLAAVRTPEVIAFLRRFRRENRFLARYFSDVRLRMNISLMGAFAFNAVYAAFQLGLGLWHHSVWFYSMASYYLLLAVMRLLLMRHTRSHAPGERQEIEWRKYRRCGVCLMFTTLALAVFICYFVWNIREFRHHEITTIAMAAYTFTALARAIVNAVRYKRYGSPAFSAAKAISLACAVVSVLTLENAMLTAFGQERSEGFRQVMLGATGAAAVLAVQGIAVYMIVNAGRKLRGFRREYE